MSEDQFTKARTFRNLHRMHGTFLMPDAWNVEGARMLEAAGFPSLGITRSDIARSLGISGRGGYITLRQTIDVISEIANAVNVPLNVDLEQGYGPTPEDVSESIWRAIDAGAVGATISDAPGFDGQAQLEAEQAADRIAAARHAADGTEINFLLTARTDCYLTGVEGPFAATVRRAKFYRRAGADCLLVPGLNNIATISSLAREIDLPLAVGVGGNSYAFAIADLQIAGVKRACLGGSLARGTVAHVQRAAEEIRQTGVFKLEEGEEVSSVDLPELFDDLWIENRA
jgi:2-methylisocitrate lyase-like PEP mutase family enzyme